MGEKNEQNLTMSSINYQNLVMKPNLIFDIELIMAVLASSVKRFSLILRPLCLFSVSLHAPKAKKLHSVIRLNL